MSFLPCNYLLSTISEYACSMHVVPKLFFKIKLSRGQQNLLRKIYSPFLTLFPLIFPNQKKVYYLKVKQMCFWKHLLFNLILQFIKTCTCTLFLTYDSRKKLWQKSKYRSQHTSTNFIKEVRNLWILEEATDRRSAKIGILKSMIFFMSSLSSIYEFF